MPYSGSARLEKDPYQSGYRSYSRSQKDQLGAEAEEEQAFQDVQTAAEELRLDELEAFEEPEQLLAHQGLDKDHSHRRTHRYNQQEYLGQSELLHKHDAH